jgi:hypothetical protein
MNTIFGNFIEKTLPNLRDALIKLVVGTNETTMNLEDFKTLMAPEPSYKVYTALVSQIGADEPLEINGDEAIPLTIGVTYEIIDNSPNLADFTNVGAPNNNIGTKFVATGTTPASWGNIDEGWAVLGYNLGAPIVTVLENTIGDIWFTYSGVGSYSVNSNELFTQFKTYYSFLNISNSDTNQKNGLQFINVSEMLIISANGETTVDDLLIMTPIEIRVYN